MWKMLFIPASLIDSKSLANRNNKSDNAYSVQSQSPRRFILPLIYLGATASLCFLFLISNESLYSKRAERGFSQLALFGGNSEKRYYSDLFLHRQVNNKKSKSNRITRTSENRSNRDQESNQLVLSSASRTHQLPSVAGRKTLFSLRKKKNKFHNNGKNGAWRSHSPKIWPSHQDLGRKIITILPVKGYKNSSNSAGLTADYYYPWKDEQCKRFYVRFADKNTFKPRALVSFPGSGNSWLRYLIENASGYFTGSVYNDPYLPNYGLWGESRPPGDGTTIVQKTHHNHAIDVKESGRIFGYRGILVIRNPYDALVSFRNFMMSLGNTSNRHKEFAKNNAFDGDEWANFVKQRMPDWTSLITTWVEKSQDYLLVLYEDVQKNPRRELVRILEYLNQTVDTARLDCLMKQENVEGPFHRPPRLTENTSHVPTTLSTSQQDTKIHVERQAQKVKSSSHSHHNHHHHPHIDEQPLLQLDSKKSQQPPQQHLQSEESSPPRTRGKGEEQKEDKFLSSSSHTISSTNSLQQEQHQNQYTSKMTSSSSGSGAAATANNIRTTSSLTTHDNHNDDDNNNNRLNKGSILRLDLIVQDNIDKINRFFKHKSIPVQLHYSLPPNKMPYYFLRTT